MKIASGCGYGFGSIDFPEHWVRQPITPSNHTKPHATLPELFGLEAQEGAQQPKDALHLGRRPGPIIGREGVEGEASDAEVERALHDTPHRSGSSAMACDAG